MMGRLYLSSRDSNYKVGTTRVRCTVISKQTQERIHGLWATQALFSERSRKMEEQERNKRRRKHVWEGQCFSMQQHPLTWVWDGLFHWGAHYCSKEKQITGEIKETERYKTRENDLLECWLETKKVSFVIFNMHVNAHVDTVKHLIPHSSQGVLLHGKHCPSHTCFLLLLFLSCSSIFLLLSEKSAWVAHKPWILSCVCLLITVHLTLVVPTL